MKKGVVLVFFLFFILSGCSHRIKRTGYSKNKTTQSVCQLSFTRSMTVSPQLAEKVGEIRLGETGFSTSCSEKHALEILRKEACSVKANLVVITEESRSNGWSTCYRCSAIFYRYKDSKHSIVPESDSYFNKEAVDQRVKNDRKGNAIMITSMVVLGIVLGVVVIAAL